MSCGILLGFTFLVNVAFAEIVQVPGTANPWLAGMKDGSAARRGDSAPVESPVPIIATRIESHATYAFSASGSVNHGSTLPFSPPDGENITSHYLGAENGIADMAAPFCSLIGVFLGPNQPDQDPAPAPLSFSILADRDYLELAPALKQPFFIGDGLTSSGVVQQVIAPIGATRLFLGVMDRCLRFGLRQQRHFYRAGNQSSFSPHRPAYAASLLKPYRRGCRCQSRQGNRCSNGCSNRLAVRHWSGTLYFYSDRTCLAVRIQPLLPGPMDALAGFAAVGKSRFGRFWIRWQCVGV